ncbi:MAG: OmpA family protein [Pseudomonadota bacterium]
MIDLRGIASTAAIPIFCLCLAVAPASAIDLALPEGAALILQEQVSNTTLRVATGAYADGTVPTIRADGAKVEQIWQILREDPSHPSVIEALVRDQLTDEGYSVVFNCSDRECGGFDFRYALPIAEGPAMYVDLGNFRYIAAERAGEDGPSYVAVTVSQGGRRAYVHLAAISPQDAALPTVVPSARAPDAAFASDGDPITALLNDGRVALDDLSFETGASSLSGRQYESLIALQAFLDENPTRSVVLVGHTDAEGSLEANIALSRARANAVRQFLIDDLGVSAGQVAAEGIGFLAPRASNATDEGREANRRVEVVLADPS